MKIMLGGSSRRAISSSEYKSEKSADNISNIIIDSSADFVIHDYGSGSNPILSPPDFNPEYKVESIIISEEEPEAAVATENTEMNTRSECYINLASPQIKV